KHPSFLIGARDDRGKTARRVGHDANLVVGARAGYGLLLCPGGGVRVGVGGSVTPDGSTAVGKGGVVAGRGVVGGVVTGTADREGDGDGEGDGLGLGENDGHGCE